MLYVAFLRAINTGNRRMKMVDLRSLYEDIGFGDVATHGATGNVIFDAPSPPLLADLESRFLERFGFTSEVFLRRGQDVGAITQTAPWTGPDDLVEVSFLEHEPVATQARALEDTTVEPERLAVIGCEVFFLRGFGRGIPPVHKESTSVQILEMKMTRRTMGTVQQIHERHIVPRM